MKSNNSGFKIMFNYMDDKCSIQVLECRQTNSFNVYDLKFKQLRYLLVNDNEDWHFIADLQPCQRLKEVIVETIKRSQKQTAILRLSAMAKSTFKKTV